MLGVVELHGGDYWKGIGELESKVNQSILDTNRDLLSGERSVATADKSLCFQSKAQGRPIDVVMASDGAVLRGNPQARDAKRAASYASRLLQSFFFSADAAQLMRDVWRIPLRASVEPKSKIDLAKVKTAGSRRGPLLTRVTR